MLRRLFFRNLECDALFLAVDHVTAVLHGWGPGRTTFDHANCLFRSTVTGIIQGLYFGDISVFVHEERHDYSIVARRRTIINRCIAVQVTLEVFLPGRSKPGLDVRNARLADEP